MKRDTIYLDTSVLNFFFEEDDLEKAYSTRELFILDGNKEIEICTSTEVIESD
jgi:hypothetical protein